MPEVNPSVPKIANNGKITVTVSENAVSAHLAHGDTIGECS